MDTKLSRHNQNVFELKHCTRVVLDVVSNICSVILFITFKVIASPDKLSPYSQPKYVTFEYSLILTSPYCMSRVLIFLFLSLVEKSIDLVLSSPTPMLNLLYTNQSHILLSELFFYSLQIFMLK